VDPALLADFRSIHTSSNLPYETDRIQQIATSSVFTLRGGLGRLVERLEEVLKSQSNVRILKNMHVKSLRLMGEGASTKVMKIRHTVSPPPFLGPPHSCLLSNHLTDTSKCCIQVEFRTDWRFSK
jgi:hypothetical protein